jgi:hypothetical protein
MVHRTQHSLEEEVRKTGAFATEVMEIDWTSRGSYQSVNFLRLRDPAYASLPFEFVLDCRLTSLVDSRRWDTEHSRFTRHRSTRTDDYIGEVHEGSSIHCVVWNE